MLNYKISILQTQLHFKTTLRCVNRQYNDLFLQISTAGRNFARAMLKFVLHDKTQAKNVRSCCVWFSILRRSNHIIAQCSLHNTNCSIRQKPSKVLVDHIWPLILKKKKTQKHSAQFKDKLYT